MSAPPRKTVSVVYVVAEDGGDFVKIGISKDAAKRVKEIQGGNPRPLRVAFTTHGTDRAIAEQIEFRTHHLLRDHRHEGEWFRCSVDLAIEAMEKAIVIVRNRRGTLTYYPELRRRRDLGQTDMELRF